MNINKFVFQANYIKDQIIYSVSVSDILSFFYLLKNLFTRYIYWVHNDMTHSVDRGCTICVVASSAT